MKQLRVLWLKSVQREVIETRIIASVKGEFFNYDSNSCLKFSSSIDAVEVSCINLIGGEETGPKTCRKIRSRPFFVTELVQCLQ